MQSFPNPDTLQRIWDAHQLGHITSLRTPDGGVMNTTLIINERHVIRFDVLDYEGISRYKGEQIAYERLRDSGVPVPEVTALDLSKTLAPYSYIILTKLDGIPLAEAWNTLSASERAKASYDSGRYLAVMHDVTFEGFGALQALPFASWFDRIVNQVHGDTEEAAELGLLGASIVQKIRQIFENHREWLEIGTQGRLAHGDFQFKNVLFHRGQITGIIDFEWANSGDPAWDFRLEALWEEHCHGIMENLYDGYESHRPFEPHHVMRVRLYKILQCVNDILFYGQDQPDSIAFQKCLFQLTGLLDLFE